MNYCPSCGSHVKSLVSDPSIKSVATPTPATTASLPTSCTRCGAPLIVSREDVIITCRYCGNTIIVATQEEVKRHGMLENRIQPQQAIDTSKKYMDEGIFRVGVAKKARITDLKLRYVPFWVFTVNVDTYYKGKKGIGVSELREMKHAVTDKKGSRWSKLGRIAKSAIELAIERQWAKKGRGRQFRTVSNSFSSHYNCVILARRTILSEINYYEVPLERKMPFDAGRIAKDAEFFNSELREEEAKGRVKAKVESKQRQLVGEEVDSIDEYVTKFRIGDGELIHAPVWSVYYNLEEEKYIITVDGSTDKVLGGGRPLFEVT